jgi:hypothetical protein
MLIYVQCGTYADEIKQHPTEGRQEPNKRSNVILASMSIQKGPREIFDMCGGNLQTKLPQY